MAKSARPSARGFERLAARIAKKRGVPVEYVKAVALRAATAGAPLATAAKLSHARPYIQEEVE